MYVLYGGYHILQGEGSRISEINSPVCLVNILTKSVELDNIVIINQPNLMVAI
jgi:hypothetical protein